MIGIERECLREKPHERRQKSKMHDRCNGLTYAGRSRPVDSRHKGDQRDDARKDEIDLNLHGNARLLLSEKERHGAMQSKKP